MFRRSLSAVAFLACQITAPVAHAQLAQSDFSAGAEGWTTTLSPPDHLGTFIAQADADPASEMAFVAPPAFTTGVSAAYRGRLTFELMTSRQQFAPSRPGVRLTGTTTAGPVSLEIRLPPPMRANAFLPYEVLLNEHQPWEVVGEARAPTAAEFREVMAGLTELRILADASSSPDEMVAIDSVRLDSAKVRVFILAGQSNMAGCTDVRSVDPIWELPQPEVLLYWGNAPAPAFGPLAPGTSGASCSNPAPEFYFGPELSFGADLAALYPNDQLAFVKFAVGGTDLFSQWTTPTGPNGEFPLGGPLWIALKQHIDDARADLNALGYVHQIDGFIWMQGESDADKRFRANAYQTKLTNFIASMRDHTGRPDMPFVLGRIRNAGQPHAQKVRDAQVAVASADPDTCWFDTDDLPWLPDGIHYDEPSMLVLGQRFANALYPFLTPYGDVNLDSRSDVDDLYDWTQNPVDLNCDGLADEADFEIVIQAVRAEE